MSTKPRISVRRPSRFGDTSGSAPFPIVHPAIPDIDPDGAEAVAYSMRGRSTQSEVGNAGEGVAPHTPSTPQRQPSVASHHPSARNPDADAGVETVAGTLNAEPGAAIPPLFAEPNLVSVKLPPEVGRQLGAIADRRGSKRTLVAVEALGEPLRSLAAAHRAGEFPELPKVISGTVRSSIAFALPPDLSADLEFILRERRAVKAQVVTRLIVPAIAAIYDLEVSRRVR